MSSKSRLPHDSQSGESLRHPEQVIAHYPLVSIVAGLSVGFGLGVLAVALFVPERKETWMNGRDFSGLLQDAKSQIRSWPHAIAEHLPDSLAHR